MRWPAALLASVALLPAAPAQEYVPKTTRAFTVRALLNARKLPDLGGPWLYCGPFDFPSFDAVLPPERRPSDLDANATYPGKGGATLRWLPAKGFEPGDTYDLLALAPPAARTDAAAFLLHEFDSPEAFTLPLALGSDDTLTVYFNGERLLHENVTRPAAADSDRVDLKVKAGRNRLLLRVGQYSGEWAVVAAPELPASFGADLQQRLDRDFPPRAAAASSSVSAEARSYSVTPFAPPEGCVLEVGGLGFTPKGDLLACTRRGEVWRVSNPTDPTKAKFTRWAGGLHEALGLEVINEDTVVVCQRPELTRVRDADGDGVADAFTTLCDRWGVSGDYHEYAFGPAFDRSGDAFVTLNVGFGGGHQAKAAWRGWCVRVSPDGTLTPFAYGLRSPNSVAFSPDGDLFYADNQGEWVATNKLCHLQRGKFYGHQASLKWLPESPFAGARGNVPTGRQYDGTDPDDPAAPKVFPAVTPPAVWFPYGRMGQSLSEPVWDTTGGKFGPFAGQCFAGDQTRATVMRVALEKVNGVWQGACFPFREGLQCGVNRLAFGPDGALYAGETARGWGSVGGKPYGLERIAFTGEVPAEVHAVTVTPEGFRMTFTKPLDPLTLAADDGLAVKSFTYVYMSRYGAPETDQRAEPVSHKTLSADGRTLTFTAPGRARGRVYEFKLTGVKTAGGEPLLHPEAYYTLNELPR